MYWWIGGRKIDGKWQWSSRNSGTYLTTYSNWHPAEPNNSGGNEECMLIHGDRMLQWNDISCFQEFAFICEKEIMSTDVVG